MSLHLERKLARMEALAARRGAVVYALLRRNAGWAVHWHEESRCVTPIPPSPPVLRIGATVEELQTWRECARAVRDANSARTHEGLIVYAYKPTLIEAVDFEISRLVQIPKET